MRMWLLLIGLLMIGLAAPVIVGITEPVIPLFSDVTSQFIVYAVLPVITILFAFVILFMRE